MKKIIYSALFVSVSVLFSFSQNEVDALRYSQSKIGGTARSVSMGNAFGSLGGDYTSVFINPASLGIYRSSEFTFTPTFYFSQADANYRDNTMTDNKYNFNLNNLGLVGSFLTGDDEGWVSANIAFGYNRTNNFHNYINIEGVNNNNSMTDYFAYRANNRDYSAVTDSTGTSVTGLSSFMGDLAWQTWLIDLDQSQGYGNQFLSPFNTYGAIQSKSITTRGHSGEYTFAFAANYSHKVYFGASMGIIGVSYDEHTEYTETDPEDKIYAFNSLTYNTHLKTTGTGFNFRFGTILRPIDWVRFGFSIQTPSFFVLHDTYETSLNSAFTDTVIADRNGGHSAISPYGEYDYQLTTPFKAVGSIALVILKKASVSFDYEFIDYSMARLRADDYTFREENNMIDTRYVPVSNFRAGLEYTAGPFAMRGGWAYYGNPYKSSEINNKLEMQTFSGGIGFRQKDFFFDIAYALNMSSENYFLYDSQTVSSGPAKIEKYTSRILTTFGFKF
mgnify:CR=1 FL=1